MSYGQKCQSKRVDFSVATVLFCQGPKIEQIQIGGQ